MNTANFKEELRNSSIIHGNAENLESNHIKKLHIKSEPADENDNFPQRVDHGENWLSTEETKEGVKDSSSNSPSQSYMMMTRESFKAELEDSSSVPDWSSHNMGKSSFPSTSGIMPTQSQEDSEALPRNILIATNEGTSDSGKDIYSYCGKLNVSANEPTMKGSFENHPDGKSYQCDICDKTFNYPSKLKEHLIIHTDEKPYICHVCSKAFSRPSHLKEHLRIHTQERAHHCDVCNKAFVHSSDLKRHSRIHTKEKPYICNVCNKSFTHSSTLKKHLKIHYQTKSYKCDVCAKAFTESTRLIQHLKIHIKERPYQCNVCNKAFSQSSTLKNHSKTHTKRKLH